MDVPWRGMESERTRAIVREEISGVLRALATITDEASPRVCTKDNQDNLNPVVLATNLREMADKLSIRTGGIWHVKGHCPACGRTSLVVGVENYLVCGHLECPDPEALNRLLDDGETDHVITIHRDSSFTLTHPLADRASGVLDWCPVHRSAMDHSSRFPAPGRYRVRLSENYDGRLSFESFTD